MPLPSLNYRSYLNMLQSQQQPRKILPKPNASPEPELHGGTKRKFSGSPTPELHGGSRPRLNGSPKPELEGGPKPKLQGGPKLAPRPTRKPLPTRRPIPTLEPPVTLEGPRNPYPTTKPPEPLPTLPSAQTPGPATTETLVGTPNPYPTTEPSPTLPSAQTRATTEDLAARRGLSADIDVPPSFIKTKVVFMSDTHSLQRDSPLYNDLLAEAADADVVIHCGGLTATSTQIEYEEASIFLSNIDAPLKVVIPGKSDSFLYEDRNKDQEAQVQALCAALERDGIMVELWERSQDIRLVNGAYLRYYAAPYSPPPYSDARFDQIDEDTDIVMTYVPPYAIRDRDEQGKHIGSPELLGRIAIARPKIHCFGQAHASWGVTNGNWVDNEEEDGELQLGWDNSRKNTTLFVNASVLSVNANVSRHDLMLPTRRPVGWTGSD
ncbi:hypothetical protein CONLIGDRAFT_236047 [Coniochaeta ligniaria NRRL 30616]|uniref:Calcineurin-like phosphoesterase domain-containing protein n=1 Tax=Coniochaeta ligniaria NRRL 30616 TaxID=1408157 RepID=A0A1J7JP68_9PEZI|nr:hypothetical protein CONLIGDRAFT_236047 [Coniochaeta ligniaria NRRL 30616]